MSNRRNSYPNDTNQKLELQEPHNQSFEASPRPTSTSERLRETTNQKGTLQVNQPNERQKASSECQRDNTLGIENRRSSMNPDVYRLSVHMSQLSANSDLKMKLWVFPGLGAIIFFFLANSTASIITNRVNGLECLFYLSSGGVFCCLIQNIIMAIKNYISGGSLWNPQNLIVEGKFKPMNLLRFAIQVCIFFGIQSFINITMYFSHITGENVGIITTLWSIQPLFSSVLDYFINGQKIQYNHILGMLFVIGSGVCISLSGKIEPKTLLRPDTPQLVTIDESVPKWVPVLFGIITPFWMIANGLFVKHLTQEHIGFDAINVSFLSSGFGSIVIVIVGVSWYWRYYAVIQWETFAIGFFSSIFDICGKACIMKAYANGPAGPVSAFVELNNVLLVIFEGIRLLKLPNYLEIIGFLLGISGALVMSIPKQIKNLLLRLFCLYRDPMVNDEDETDEVLKGLKQEEEILMQGGSHGKKQGAKHN